MKNFFSKWNKEEIEKQLKAGRGKKGTTVKSHIPFRLNFIFLIIFILFIALIGQLAYLQIVNGESISKQLKESSTVKITGSTPRGDIYDAKGKPIVTSSANPAITFTRGNQMKASDLLKVANKLNEIIDVPVDEKLKERDLKDYWLADEKNLEKATKRLSDKEAALTDTGAQYSAIVDKVKDSEIKFNETEKKAATIYKKMNGAVALNTVYVKDRDVTDKELAVVAENATELPGVSTGTDWSREFSTEDSSLQDLVGTLSNNGLPAEELEDYLAKGYARNDRVGTSYLEKQYESVLQGTKSQYQITLDRSGNISSQEEIYSGEKGSNLMLTIDQAFQTKIEDILKKYYQPLVNNGVAQYSPGIYAVAMNPKTGAVLGMAGYHHKVNSKKIEQHALGTFTAAFTPGSVVKGGTLTAGWQTGVLKGNDVLYDEPIKVDRTAAKASIYNKDGSANRSLTAEKALEISSNAYMMKVALKMLGISYYKDVAMPYLDKQETAFAELRQGLAEYGMGVSTGIDLPNEESGISRAVKLLDNNGDGAKILDLSFGQFDTYTALQLAQYSATVANGGKRIQPHLVQGIYNNDENGNLGSLNKSITPKVLNTVGISNAQMKIIQDGFYDAVHGNDPYTTATILKDAKFDVSAKTGTAETEVYEDGKKLSDTVNSNIIAYGPSDDAEIAISLMMPQLKQDDAHVNVQIAKEIMNAYHDLYMK